FRRARPTDALAVPKMEATTGRFKWLLLSGWNRRAAGVLWFGSMKLYRANVPSATCLRKSSRSSKLPMRSSSQQFPERHHLRRAIVVHPPRSTPA
ncbi:MAG: hypothetical protein LC799_13600, partial [Actinobacteria bacterium]|nr:hypothetical protein [Actinomycetota bacterium]